jgi:hypothetical protein
VDVYAEFVVTERPLPELDLIPAGLAGFLDRAWEEAAGGGGGLTEAPVVGELVLFTTYEVGDVITGCADVVDQTGAQAEIDFLTLSWYAVTIGEVFDTREPLDAQVLFRNPLTGAFCFEIETDGLEPGYYDVRLGIPQQDYQWVRIELVSASD